MATPFLPKLKNFCNMNIDLIIDSDVDCDLSSQDLELIAENALEKLELKKPHTTVEVFLVSNAKIQEINKKFRDKDEATDVLSFPQESFPEAKEETLGTIFIAPEFAKTIPVDPKNLFAHGLLHLMGYDHESNLEEWDLAENRIGEKTL